MDIKLLAEMPPWDWPEDAGDIFEDILLDREAPPEDRLIAVELAGNTIAMNDDLAETLLAVIGDPHETEELRAKAAISLSPTLELSDTDGFDDPYRDEQITEEAFDNLRNSLHDLYLNSEIPKLVRRRIFEAAVRAQQDWQKDAIRAAYASGDREWMLTAIFGMRYLSGFDDLILEALKIKDPEIQSEAIQAAADWEIAAAGPLAVALVEDPNTPKFLLLAAIGAVGDLYPMEARQILRKLSKSDDEEIAAAVQESIDFAESGDFVEEDDFDEEDEDTSGWVN